MSKALEELLEDAFDAALARERRDEPQESLEDVKRRLLKAEKLPKK